MSVIYIDSNTCPGELLKTLLTLRSQSPNTTVIINVVQDCFSYITDALAIYDILAMFKPNGKQPLNIELHLKTHATQFILLATAALPKDKVFVGEGVVLKWREFNEDVWGTESSQEDQIIYYEKAERNLSTILESAYDLGIDDIKQNAEEGRVWLEDDIRVFIDAKTLDESPNYSALPSKLELKQEPIIVFNDDFYNRSGAKFISTIDAFRIAGFKELIIIVNSPGGCVFTMLAMLGARERFGGNIKVMAVGLAASAGGFFLTSAPKGSRLATSNSIYMIHQFRGYNSRKGFENNRWMGEQLTDLLSESSNLPRERVQELLQRDTFLTAQEALEYGFIDAIIGDE